jgi:hypothetical protein
MLSIGRNGISAFAIVMAMSTPSLAQSASDGRYEAVFEDSLLPPIKTYIETNFRDIDIVLSGRVRKSVQSGVYIGPIQILENGKSIGPGKYLYVLDEIEIDKLFKGRALISEEKRKIFVVTVMGCSTCKVTKIDVQISIPKFSEKNRIIFICNKNNDSNYLKELNKVLTDQLALRGNHYDFVTVRWCNYLHDYNDSEDDILFMVRKYFDMRK